MSKCVERRDWRDKKLFYKVNGRCCVCGEVKLIGQEPRFGYSVCEEHSNLRPIDITRWKLDKKPK